MSRVLAVAFDWVVVVVLVSLTIAYGGYGLGYWPNPDLSAFSLTCAFFWLTCNALEDAVRRTARRPTPKGDNA